MARILPLSYEASTGDARAEFDRTLEHGRLTNMKQTLGHSPVALRALMQWYPLRDEVETFLGQRSTIIYVHAISSATDCLICSTFFRRILIDGGENPDELHLDEREAALVEYGRQLVREPNQVSDNLYQRLASFLNQPRLSR